MKVDKLKSGWELHSHGTWWAIKIPLEYSVGTDFAYNVKNIGKEKYIKKIWKGMKEYERSQSGV